MKLELMVRETQAQARVPALSAALRRDDRDLWTFQVGTSGTLARSTHRAAFASAL